LKFRFFFLFKNFKLNFSVNCKHILIYIMNEEKHELTKTKN
jgi:hypothetical protein